MPSGPSGPSPAQAPATRRFARKVSAADAAKPASQLIDERIGALADWRGELLGHLRSVIRGADPRIVEAWKWNTPVWTCDGIICTGESYKNWVKLTFAQGASLPDPARLFNASLQGGTRRAIDFTQGAPVDDAALADLIRAAVALNQAAGTKPAR